MAPSLRSELSRPLGWEAGGKGISTVQLLSALITYYDICNLIYTTILLTELLALLLPQNKSQN